MSLPPSGSVSIPEETARLARTICPKGTLYMRIRDQLGVIFENHLFAPLFSPRGQPAWYLTPLFGMFGHEGSEVYTTVRKSS